MEIFNSTKCIINILATFDHKKTANVNTFPKYFNHILPKGREEVVRSFYWKIFFVITSLAMIVL